MADPHAGPPPGVGELAADVRVRTNEKPKRTSGEILAMIQQYVALQFKTREKRDEVRGIIEPLSPWGQDEVVTFLGRAEALGKFSRAVAIVKAFKTTWASQPAQIRADPRYSGNGERMERAYGELGIPPNL